MDGEVRHAQGSPDKVRVRGGSLNTERWNDIEAPERVIERAWNAAKSASSWQIFHRTIAEYGLSYTPYRKGRANGAIWELQRIKDDGTVLKEHRKASVIPNASWMKMLKKLGEVYDRRADDGKYPLLYLGDVPPGLERGIDLLKKMWKFYPQKSCLGRYTMKRTINKKIKNTAPFLAAIFPFSGRSALAAHSQALESQQARYLFRHIPGTSKSRK